MRALRNWQHRYGAELVCNDGTLLQRVVERPPQTPDDAFALAAQQYDLARDTLTLPLVSLREHARALIGRRQWLLHSRP